jgi:hypothetical protein
MSQLSVDSITGRVAGTSPTFPNGFQVTGIVTATTLNQTVTGATSFQGSTTFDNGFTVSGATGIITATGFSGPLTGNVTGAVTGNVTGNCSGTAGSTGVLSAGATGADLTLSGNLTVNGTTTTIDTAVTAVDSLAVDGDVNVGAAISAADYEGNFVLDMYLFS